LKRELEEAKIIEYVLRIQMKKKEKYCINHEHEIVTLRA